MSTTVNPFGRIVIAYDGSPPADAALDQALALAERYEGGIVVVHATTLTRATVIPLESVIGSARYDIHPLLASLEPDCRDVFEKVRSRVASRAVPASMEFTMNGTVAGILDAAERWNATAIVVGTRARTGLAHLWDGSVAESLVQTAIVPVVVVRAGMLASSLRRIVVGFDYTEPHSSASTFAIALGNVGDTKFVYCTIIDTKTMLNPTADMPFDPLPWWHNLRAEAQNALDAALHDAVSAGIRPLGELAEATEVGSELIEVAHRHKADAIVVGTHKRGPLTSALLGSTAESIFRHSDIPVIAVPTDVPVPAAAPASEHLGT